MAFATTASQSLLQLEEVRSSATWSSQVLELLARICLRCGAGLGRAQPLPAGREVGGSAILLSALKHVIDEACFAGPYRRGNTHRTADLGDRLHRLRID